MSEIDIEIKNNHALSYLLHEIQQLKKEIDQLKAGICPKCDSKMEFVEGHNIYACTGNCGHWKNVLLEENETG